MIKTYFIKIFVYHININTLVRYLSYWDQTRVYKGIKWRQPQMEDDLQRKMTSKYEKLNISVTTGRILLKFET